jgi:hypothetical protein
VRLYDFRRLRLQDRIGVIANGKFPEGWPEKSGMSLVGCCVNAGDENSAAAALVVMKTVGIMDISRYGRWTTIFKRAPVSTGKTAQSSNDRPRWDRAWKFTGLRAGPAGRIEPLDQVLALPKEALNERNWPDLAAALFPCELRYLGWTCRGLILAARRFVTDTVEKVPKCLLAIFSKETKLSYARQLIRRPGRCRSLCELFH